MNEPPEKLFQKRDVQNSVKEKSKIFKKNRAYSKKVKKEKLSESF